MKAFPQRCICVFLILILLLSSALADSRDEIRAAWQSVRDACSFDTPFDTLPDLETQSAGSLSEEAQAQALAYLNFLRDLAGLEPVSLDPLYTLRSQNGAFLLAVNDELTHTPEKPEGMDEGLYESAAAGTLYGDLVRFNWMKPDILIDALSYFARDDGDINLRELSHRGWLLNPAMLTTGFGLACSESGMSYAAMYAVDCGRDGCSRDRVCWPAEGLFPADLMRDGIAWSVSVDDTVYTVTDELCVTMTEERSGAEFRLCADAESPDGSCCVSSEACGSGSCIIFRPELQSRGLDAYEQNQIWNVRIEGLRDSAGDPAEIAYRCEMISLLPQDPANVELSRLEADCAAGDTLVLRANVIPAYADDLRVVWSSSDETVAVVDGNGLVTALAEGECVITASTVNGREDSCTIRVK